MKDMINEKMQNHSETKTENYRENLTKAKDSAASLAEKFKSGEYHPTAITNCAFRLREAGENVLEQKIYSEIFIKAGILNTQKMLDVLGADGVPSRESLSKFFGMYGHYIRKFNNPRIKNTPFCTIIERLLADISAITEDPKDIRLYKDIGEEEKLKEAQKNIDNLMPGEYTSKDFYKYMASDVLTEYYAERDARNESIERINACRDAISRFLNEAKNLREYDIDIEKVIEEIGQEIDNKLEK